MCQHFLVFTYVVCEKLTVMHLQVSGWTVNFGPNFPESPFSGIEDQKAPPPFWKTSDLGWPKFTPEYPPYFGKLQIWDDQSLLQNTPPSLENFRFGMTKVYSGIPPPFWKTSDLGWPKFTLEYLPILENFRFGMSKVYSRIRPLFRKTSESRWSEVYSGILPLFRKTSDLGWPKYYSVITPPISENFRSGMTKVYSGIPPSPPMLIVRWVQVRDFQNTESHYMWRLCPTRITTSWIMWSRWISSPWERSQIVIKGLASE